MTRWMKVIRGISLLIALAGAAIGVMTVFPAPVVSTSARSAFVPDLADPVRLVFAPQNTRGSDQPFLITRGGALLQPDSTGKNWQQIDLNASVNDLYIDRPDHMWAGTDAGLLEYQDGQWQPVADIAPTYHLVSTHGFLFALGSRGVSRLSAEPSASSEWRHLKVPDTHAETDQDPGLVMLGNHSHVLFNGGLVITSDVGLSWKLLQAVPDRLQSVTTDVEGNLLAVTDQNVQRWNYQSQTWSKMAELPAGTAIDVLTLFQEQAYALAGGQLYRLNRSEWQKVEFSTESGYYFTALQYHYPSTLWAADALHQMLCWSADGITWQLEPIQTVNNTP